MHDILDACFSNCRLGEVNEKTVEHTPLNQTCRKWHLPEVTEHASIPQPPQLNFIQSPHRVMVFSFHTNSKSVLKIKLQPIRGESKKKKQEHILQKEKEKCDEIAHEDIMKKVIMFLYIYFCYIPPSFCFIHGQIMRWLAWGHPQPSSLITHLAALWSLFASSLAAVSARQRETTALTTFIDILMLWSILL